jgi:hypothetical protein
VPGKIQSTISTNWKTLNNYASKNAPITFLKLRLLQQLDGRVHPIHEAQIVKIHATFEAIDYHKKKYNQTRVLVTYIAQNDFVGFHTSVPRVYKKIIYNMM